MKPGAPATVIAMAWAGTPLDDAVTGWVIDNRGEPWIGLAQAVTILGNTLILGLVALAVAGLFLLRGDRRVAAVLAGGTVLGYALMVVLKEIFGRERPPLTDRLLDLDTHSFPSGHAMMSTVVYGLIAVGCYHAFAAVRRHAYVLLLAPALALLIGATRIYLGVHWFTDVVAGWLIGALVVACGAWLLSRQQRSATRDVVHSV